jgi:pyridoxamine 5'-phosphate oxidase
MPVPDDLDAVLDDAWARLVRGAKDRRSAFHTPVVATGGDAVRQRVMVLRAADRAAATLRFHTDRRSAKVAMIDAASRVSVLGYDPAARIQVSMQGTAHFADDPTPFWEASALTSRRCYLVEPGPGTQVDSAQSGIPDAFLSRTPNVAESEPGATNFAVLIVTIDRLEWLELSASGGRRAGFERDGAGWSGTWLIP